MPAVGSVNVRISATTSGLTSGLNSASSSLTAFSGKMRGVAQNSLGSLGSGAESATSRVSGLTSSLIDLAVKAVVVGGALVALRGAYSALSTGIAGAVAFEQSSVAFEVLLGSATKATAMISELQDYATTSPFTIQGVNESAQQLMNYGITGTKILPTIKMLGDVAAGDAEKMQRLGTAFGQMSAAGRLMGQDLLQFINAGFNPLQEISKKTGESMIQLKKRMEAGRIASSEVEAAFQAATSAGGRFYGMTEKQAKSLGGLWNSLSENVTVALRDVSMVLIDAFSVKSTMSGLIAFTQSIAGRVKALTPIIQTVASVFSSAWGVISAGAGALFGGLMSRVPVTFATIVTSVKKAGAWINSTFEAIKPIVAATGAFIAASWAAIGSGALWVFNYVYEVASSWFTNISTIFSNLTGITGVTFDSIKLFMIDALILGEFLFNNFADVSALAFEKTKLAAVTMFADIGHFFTGVIPTWFDWFSSNWSDVFFSAFDLASTVFINLGTNIRKMFASLWDYIKSGFTTSFEINWTPLTEGAVNAVKKLPEIPARAVTELEQKLKNNVGRMGDNLGQKLGDHMVKRREELLGKPPEMPARVNVTGTEVNTGPSGMASATPAAVAKKPVEGVAALNRGSSDATSAIIKAMRGAPVQEKILKVAEKQLVETKRVATSLDTMTSGDGLTFVAGEVPA